mmetsp:Transcript_14966/g.20930  ORF Transcript_14966/g.20930 Transcript_14966/m.20930 type:complete len:459 (-) Transcript_14966:52-1428(-)
MENVKPRVFASTLLLLSLVATLADASLFYVNGTLVKEVNSPSIRPKKHFDISAKVVFANPEDWCSEIKNSNAELEGNILWINPTTGPVTCNLAERIQKAEKRGVKGVIYANSGYGHGHGILAYFINYDMEHVHKSSIPAIEISHQDNKDLLKLLKDDSNVMTVVMTEGKNDITDTENVWDAYSVIFGLYTAACLLLAGYKQYLFIDLHGIQASVPQGCLFLNILSSIFRLLICIDPPYTRGIFPFQFSAVLDLLNYPILLCASLLMAFYWEDAMRAAKVHAIPTLQKMKKPFIISACILMFLACLCVVFRSLNSFPKVVMTINIIIILVFTVPITFFYTVEAIKILKILFASKTINMGRRQTALYKMTLFLVGSAVAMFAYVIEVIVLAALPYTINNLITIRWFFHFSINSVSFFQALAFQNPASSKTSNSSDPKVPSPTLKTQKSMDVNVELQEPQN